MLVAEVGQQIHHVVRTRSQSRKKLSDLGQLTLGLVLGFVLAFVMTAVLDLARAIEVIHKAAVRKGINRGLRSFVRHGQHELTSALCLRFVVVTSDQVEISAASCIEVMNHVACLSIQSQKWCQSKHNPFTEKPPQEAQPNTVHHVIVGA